MAKQALTTPVIQINGNYWQIIANSAKFISGFGEYSVKTQVSGANAETVYELDLTKAFGGITFSMRSTLENDSLVDDTLRNNPNNVVQITQNGFSKTMPTAAISNDPERGLGVDGQIDIEIKGDRLV